MLNKRKYVSLVLALISSFTLASSAIADPATAPVSGSAHNFLTSKAIPNATLTILENGQKLKTDREGKFGPFFWPVGKSLTMVLEKEGYRPTQSATFIVPPEGLTGPYNNITFQAFDSLTFSAFSKIIGAKIDESKCHVGATITAYHKNMDDLPQGEPHSKVVITPAVSETPFYFDIFKEGPLKNYPNPFTRGLTETSEDGGVVLTNLEPRDEPYTMTAIKSGVVFNEVQFICRKGMFINLSPPDGPMVQKAIG